MLLFLYWEGIFK